jgi:hypothetical protein
MADAMGATIYLRAGSRCECCGKVAGWDGWSRHHRQPRGMGGTKRDVHQPSNMLLLCGSGTTGCHGLVESERSWAYECGLLVRRPFEPGRVALLYHAMTHAPRWVTLDNLGGVHDLVDSPPLVPQPRKERS